MNPTQQKGHTKRTDELEQMIADLATVSQSELNRLGKHIDTQVAHMDKRVNEILDHVQKLAEEQRAYVDTEDRRNRERLSQFTCRTFWQRLKWLVLGEAV